MNDGAELRSGEVEYTLDDLRELARLSSSTILRMAKIFGWMLLVIAAVTFALSRLLHTPYQLIDFLLALAIAALLMLLGSPRQRAYTWRWQMRRSPLHAPQTFTITPAGLEVASRIARSTIVWAAFCRLCRRGERLFLFLTERTAYIVPRRAFDSDGEFDAFVAAAEERWTTRHRL